MIKIYLINRIGSKQALTCKLYFEILNYYWLQGFIRIAYHTNYMSQKEISYYWNLCIKEMKTTLSILYVINRVFLS